MRNIVSHLLLSFGSLLSQASHALVGPACVAGLMLAGAGDAKAQYTYGANSAGQSCIANLTDCYAAPGSGHSSRGGGRARLHAAFAVTKGNDTIFSWSSGWNSRAGAEREALARCERSAGNANACVIAIWFYNTCGAFAQDADGSWGAQHASSRPDAERMALKICAGHSRLGQCKVVKSFCQ